MSLQPGQIIGDYEVIGALGAGGMGSVFKARNLISDRVDALKILLPDLRASHDLAERFVNEIRVLASLTHPHIAALHTALRVDNQLIMIMEFVDGTNLETRLESGGVSPAEGIRYISEVLSALSYAHSRGVVHRDIKPANIAINSQGSVKLIDFGLARDAANRHLTRQGMVLGSLYYMSPEQVSGKQADNRSDIYSAGITLYRVLTGRRPIDGDSEFAVMRAQIQDLPLPLYHWNKAIPTALSDIVLRALEKAPERRFQSANEFRAALAPFVGRRVAPQLSYEATVTMFQPATEPVSPTPIPSTAAFDAPTLNTLRNTLAESVGPIAGPLVKKYSRTAASIHELCASLASEIGSESARKAFLDRIGSQLGAVPAPPAAPPASAPPPSPPRALDPAATERCRQLLAEHIGPMAKILVNRASKTATSLDELYAMLSSEISSPADRDRFLKAGGQRPD